MRNALKLIAILASAFTFVNLSAQTLPGGLPNIPTTLNLERLKVSQQTVFQGNVIFDQGLNLTGRGNFLNDINILGGISVAKNIVFPGLPQVDYINNLITGDPNGNITKVPLEVLARELAKRGLPSLENLNVTKVTTLNGDVFLGQGLNINGEALFNNNLITKGNLAVGGSVSMAGLNKVSTSTKVSILGVNQDGSLGTIDVEDLLTGTVGNIDPCPDLPAPSRWISSQNQIVTDQCSKEVKVGIGTQLPSQRLEVAGNALVTGGIGFANPGNEANLFLGNTGYSVMSTKQKGMGFSTPQAVNGLFMTDNGSVGIGTGANLNDIKAKLHIKAENTNPLIVQGNDPEKYLLKLDQQGVLWSKEINVVLNVFPDYVFQPEYKLMPLSEVKEFIKTYGRLPDMPSAKEVESKGADLGELTRLLTQKVEELTLYTIQLQERIKELENKK